MGRVGYILLTNYIFAVFKVHLKINLVRANSYDLKKALQIILKLVLEVHPILCQLNFLFLIYHKWTKDRPLLSGYKHL